jgi:hypothetical protein
MSNQAASGPSRRDFLKSGALMAAPVVAVAVPAVALADDGTRTRLARLEAERAVEGLHRTWLKSAAPSEIEGANQVARIVPAHDAVRVDIAECGTRATASQACTVEIAEDAADDCTLLRMARAQGNPPIARAEAREIRARYALKGQAGWQLEAIALG